MQIHDIAVPLRPLLPLVALIFGAVGFVVVMFVVPVVLARIAPLVAARRELHQTHKHSVPRLGGIALAAAFAIVSVASFVLSSDAGAAVQPKLVLVLSALAMFALGLWDDIKPLGAKKKLLGQILIASAAYAGGLVVDTIKNPLTGEIYSLGLWSYAATVFWLVALTNLVNLIDGIDGLASGISLMLMCLLVYVSFGGQSFAFCVAMGMVGALVAFLYFNFPPAKIYLGDGGAYFLGYLIGALAIQNSNKGTIVAALIAPILALALPILDVAFSIVRRGMKGLPIFRPDRRHIHHRLLHAGLSRRRAVLVLYGISMIFLVLAFAAFWSGGRWTPILAGCGFLIVLVIAPSLGIIKNWLTVGATFGNSLEMRREIQYALLLRNFLEMEAGRTGSLPELWDDFTFTLRKLGFASARLSHGGRAWSWALPAGENERQSWRHELHITGETLHLELEAPSHMDDNHFHLLCELAAESWLTAARRWAERHEVTFGLPERDAVPVDVEAAAYTVA